jgi:hypothetical protein
MRSKSTHIASVMAAMAVGAVLVAVPISSATSIDESCQGTGGGTVCQSPGNVQLNDSPAPVPFYPFGGEAFLLGGNGFGGFHGGAFHGGGFGGAFHGGHR